MTVIKQLQNTYEFPNSNANSDTDSLTLGSTATSDAESVHNETLQNRRLFRPLYRRPTTVELDENKIFLKHGGKRKLRRYHNRTVLQTLNEEDTDVETFDIFESIRSPLSKLFEHPGALEFWNRFIEKPEEEQQQIIEDLNLRKKCENCKSSKAINPFLRISSKIRRTLKIRRNLSVETVKSFEDDVVEFFSHSPLDKYVKYPHTSFERLLTHAVAQYHCLHSLSDWENEKKKVEIYNVKENWTPAECFLHEFITQMRS